MRAAIIEDEIPARLELKRLLERHSEIRVCGEAGELAAARALVLREKPELLFLDVHLTGGDAFELLRDLEPPLPQVLFTTASTRHALRAFELDAVDYLLKPIHPDRLAEALTRVRRRQGTGPLPALETETSVCTDTEDPGKASGPSLTLEDPIYVREGEWGWVITVGQIELLEVEGNSTRLYFGKGSALVYKSLGALEGRLPQETFLRANRTQILNLTCVAHLGQWFSQTLKVQLKSGREVELSRRQSQVFRERLSL